MQINISGNQNFGRIYVDETIKPVLLDEILSDSTHSERELKEALASLVDVANSTDRDIFIGKSGTVSYTAPELKGKRYQDQSYYNLGGKLMHALGRLRSYELQKQIHQRERRLRGKIL